MSTATAPAPEPATKPRSRKARVAKPRMVIASYHAAIGGMPCLLDFNLHAKGCLVPCREGDQPHRWERDWDATNPLGSAKLAAEGAVARSAECVTKFRGSLADGLPKVRRLLDAAAQGAFVIIPTKGPSRHVRQAKTPAVETVEL